MQSHLFQQLIIPLDAHTFFQDVKKHWFHCGDVSPMREIPETLGLEPFTLPDGKPIVEIVAMLKSIFIRNNKGQWYACGDNSVNQLGVVSDSHTLPITRIQLPSGKPIDKIATSGRHTYMRGFDGQLFGCGSNHYGQLLHLKAPRIGLTPIELPNHKSIVAIRLGSYHTLLKDNEGNWYGCGKNQHGQLGPDNLKKFGQPFYIDPIIFEKVNAEEANLQSRPSNS